MQRVSIGLASLIVLLVAAGSGSAALGACTGATVSHVTAKTSAVRLNDKIFFRTSGLELDFDGNPHAYGVRDQGEENICVGLAPLAPPCHGKYQGTCYPVCQKTFADWSQSSGDPKLLGKTMCSVGLGGGGCSKPDVRVQAAPNQDWFVSETSLKISPPSGPVSGDWLRSQPAQLDPAKVRYLVAPGALMRPPWNAKLGDVGIAYNVASKETVPFIVGDGGGLGEGSVSLLAALRPDKPPKLTKARSALGEEVMRYTAGISGDFQFVIFTNTASHVTGKSNVMTHTADELNDWIDATARKAFDTHSSLKEIMSCSMLAPPVIK